jgi:hypothetical protein
MKKIFGLMLFEVLCLAQSCSMGNIPENSTIGETTIGRLNRERLESMPFEDEEILKGFAGDPEILDHNTARKIALVEFLATGMDKDMGWEGNRITKTPVVIYGFDNRPKYYDFIVIDGEKNTIGTITVHARRTAATTIHAVSEGIKDYAGLLSKAGGINASLFEDWTGGSYLGIRGKAGNSPDNVIDAETGETAEGIKELTDEEIIEVLTGAYSSLEAFNPAAIDIPQEDPPYAGAQIAMAKHETAPQTPENTGAALNRALSDKNAQSGAFWEEVDKILPEIESINDEEEIIDSSSKGLFSSLASWVAHKVVALFAGVDTDRYYIEKYTGYRDSSYEIKPNPWCGPWVCGYLMWIKDGRSGNYFDVFYNLASTVGEFSILNFTLRAAGRPMTPMEMSWELPLVSQGKIWLLNTWLFNDSAAYDYIKTTKNPAILLCMATGRGGKKELHWRIAVGARRTGSVFSETFYFLQHDNKDRGENGVKGRKAALKRDNNNEYKTVEWWNPWFLVVAP